MLVGESGAGKTTILRLLAGLERPLAGRIRSNGAEWLDTRAPSGAPGLAARRRVRAAGPRAVPPPERRGERRLRSARPRARARPSGGGAWATRWPRRASRASDRACPRGLSGGEQQRVALARALAPAPALLLLDEPLAALDLQTRRAVRTELRELLGRLPCITVYVTHSPVEALVFGDQIVVLERGRVSQTGPREDLLRYPRSPFVAELMGTNLFIGRSRRRRAARPWPGAHARRRRHGLRASRRVATSFSP